MGLYQPNPITILFPHRTFAPSPDQLIRLLSLPAWFVTFWGFLGAFLRGTFVTKDNHSMPNMTGRPGYRTMENEWREFCVVPRSYPFRPLVFYSV